MGATWARIAGGGTAGHVLPGLAIARALVDRGHDPSSIPRSLPTKWMADGSWPLATSALAMAMPGRT